MKTLLISLSVAAVTLASAVQASTVTVTGDATQLPSVPAVVNNATPGSDTSILWFQESSYALVTDDQAGLGGTSIAAGDRVDTYMIFLNRETRSSARPSTSFGAMFDFSTAILGIFGEEDGADLNATDYLASATTYAPINTNRGIENDNDGTFAAGGSSNDLLAHVIGSTLLDVKLLNVTQPGDWVRVAVVSAVPVPAGALLLPLGLGALAFTKRRKRKAQAV